MSDNPEMDGRPAKRARLDDSTTAQAAPAYSTPAAKGPLGSTNPSIHEDLDRETRAGITEYVCADNLGFRGILKQRYTDFLVNEIGLDGKVVKLEKIQVNRNHVQENDRKEVGDKEKETEISSKVVVEEFKVENNGESVTKDVVAEATPKDVEPTEEKTVPEDPPPSEEDFATLHSIFGESTTSEILTLVRAIRRHDQKKAKDFKAVIAAPIEDKELRTQAHHSLRRIFPNLLESGMEADQSIRIKAIPPKERNGKKSSRGTNSREGRQRGQLGWEERGGEFLHFTLYKENKDTMEVINFIGSKLTTGSKALSFAGTKDRRACTVQRVCVKRQTAERMSSFNSLLRNSAIGDYSYHKHDLRLGDLKGNEFHITLRDCHFQCEEGLEFAQRMKMANEIVAKAIADFSEKGFINYYGLQRFGSFAASTDTVGLKLLQGDLKGACDDLLAYTDTALAAANNEGEDQTIQVSQDDRNRAKALHLWQTTGKGSAALDILPRKFNAERNLIQHLSSRNGKSGVHDRKSDWQGSLMCISRNLRLMYVHAYQSLVWNTVAGKRWSTYGDKVVEGDLVLVHEHKDKEPKAAAVPDQTIDQDGEVIINPSGADSALAAEDQFERARALTADEAASGKYSVYDIVLPQPGFDVEYPKNEIGTFYEEFMGSERGGGLDPHNMRRSWREVSLSGGYRKFLAKPLAPLEFQVREYVRPEEQFVQTDLQRLQGERIEKTDGDAEMMDEGEEQAEKKIAVLVKLQLASSQYATIALRELCKADGVKAFKPMFMGGR